MEAKDLMNLYVAYLRALYQIHQNSHWKASGENSYGNHLLFERLYQSVQEDADKAAEKTIGLFGDLNILSNVISEITNKFNSENVLTNSLSAEKTFLELSELVYNKLSETSPGLNDLLTEISGRHEVNLYLLGQSAK